jgi:hypothetical protein
MKVNASIVLTIDIDTAREMGIEIDDPHEYAMSEMVEYLYEMMRHNELEGIIHIEEGE